MERPESRGYFLELRRPSVFFFFASPPNYFTSSDPHHDMLGGGCQVRVVIENMMGRMENLRTLISGFLGLVITSEMGFGHDVPFLNYSDRLPHPSDLCQPDRVR